MVNMFKFCSYLDLFSLYWNFMKLHPFLWPTWLNQDVVQQTLLLQGWLRSLKGALCGLCSWSRSLGGLGGKVARCFQTETYELSKKMMKDDESDESDSFSQILTLIIAKTSQNCQKAQPELLLSCDRWVPSQFEQQKDVKFVGSNCSARSGWVLNPRFSVAADNSAAVWA